MTLDHCFKSRSLILAAALIAGPASHAFAQGLPLSFPVQRVSDLGSLPTGMSINWPQPPSIERDIDIDSENFPTAYVTANKSRTRFRFQENIDEEVIVSASDVEIVIAPGVKLRNIVLNPRVQRVKISGGEVGKIRAVGSTESLTFRQSIFPSFPFPGRTSPSPKGYVTDILIDSITLNHNAEGEPSLCPTDFRDCFGIMLGAVSRVAIINSRISSLVYPIAAWSPSNPPSFFRRNKNEDIIIANNRLHSVLGEEATVRIHDSVRTVTVHNRLQNGNDSVPWKHNYRIHGLLLNGGARYAYAAYNLLINSGVMIGEGGYSSPPARPDAPPPPPPAESVRNYWFNNNQFYQLAPSLYQMGVSAVHDVEIRDNHAYSKVDWHLDCFYCPSDAPGDWIIMDNLVEPYPDSIRPPP